MFFIPDSPLNLRGLTMEFAPYDLSTLYKLSQVHYTDWLFNLKYLKFFHIAMLYLSIRPEFFSSFMDCLYCFEQGVYNIYDRTVPCKYVIFWKSQIIIFLIILLTFVPRLIQNKKKITFKHGISKLHVSFIWLSVSVMTVSNYFFTYFLSDPFFFFLYYCFMALNYYANFK